MQRVVDGDTIVLADGERVRYTSVDIPEVVGTPEFYGPQASDANRRLLEGRRIRLEWDVSDTNRFGRLLRYVYVEGVMVNADLVRERFARALVYPLDMCYAPGLASLEDEAREEGLGKWSE